MSSVLLDPREGFPLTERAKAAGDGFFQSLRILFELDLALEESTKEIKESFLVRLIGIDQTIEHAIPVAAIQHHI